MSPAGRDLGRLAGKVVVVTGAGRGLGRAHALALAAAGAQVVVNDLGVNADGTQPRSAPAEEVVAEVAAGGGSAIASAHDVSDEDGAAAIVATAVEGFGRLDAVVNNAGILRSGLLLRTSAPDFRKVVDVHLTGTFLVTRAAVSHWRERVKSGHDSVDGRIVNTSSSAGLYGFVGETAYGAAKAAVAAFTLIAAAEIERYGVSVNAIAPQALTRLTAWAAGDPSTQLPGPEAVSPLVVWLCSDAARGVTGRVFEVGGGRVAVANGWTPGRWADAPAVDDLDAVVPQLLAEAPEPQPVFVPR
jgi:NAD(P)-dependent dehydrogenase (short-subunit alcohol dehydrogenase family)